MAGPRHGASENRNGGLSVLNVPAASRTSVKASRWASWASVIASSTVR